MNNENQSAYVLLHQIQRELVAPKSQFNKFGNYSYRNCEDILSAVKPHLTDNFVITISDEIVTIGDRYYVKATATLTNGVSSVGNTAYARESLDKKGMDDSQITGATSSYARKYALNGLFAIDDTKDADSLDNRKNPEVREHITDEDTETHVCHEHNIDLVRSSKGKWYHKNPEDNNEFCFGSGYVKFDKS